MSSTSVEIARNCTMAAEVSRQSIDAANVGAAVVHETILGMSVIADRVRQTSSTIEARGAEETAAAAAHLAGQSRALKNLMSDFKVA